MKTQQQSLSLDVGVKIFLANKDNHYLFLKRVKAFSPNKIRYWDIPGGRIIPGEPLITALQREVYEETGLTLETNVTLLTAQDIIKEQIKHIVRITYLLPTKIKGKVRLNPEEHSEYRWVPLEEIATMQYDPYLSLPIETLLRKSS